MLQQARLQRQRAREILHASLEAGQTLLQEQNTRWKELKKRRATRTKPSRSIWLSRRTVTQQTDNVYVQRRERLVHTTVLLFILMLVLAFFAGAIFETIWSSDDDDVLSTAYFSQKILLERQLQAQKQDTYNCLQALYQQDCQKQGSSGGMPYVVLPEPEESDV